jgi:hypothetical protein
MIFKKFDEKRTKSDKNSKILMFTECQRDFGCFLRNLPQIKKNTSKNEKVLQKCKKIKKRFLFL